VVSCCTRRRTSSTQPIAGKFLLSVPEHINPRRARAYLLTDTDVRGITERHAETGSLAARDCGAGPERVDAQDDEVEAEAGFDGLAEPDVICDQQRDAGHPQRLRDRLQLIVLDLNTRSKRRLERRDVRRGDAAPADGVDERAAVTSA
jgi:hypothetical protein